ncbi:protein IN2-1 homolog A [Lolium perenne]|jgi:glutathione S-transferase|uniref:protein IN2-1 homolog A n=1 Tax=Lolium perenne TaxID=4522 RepID=UPI0021F593E0|nr:protein IN2-1 homolog A-like [Lolium perenne]
MFRSLRVITSASCHIPVLANYAGMAAAAAPSRSFTKEVLPPALGAVSEPPPLFDGTTRLYVCYICPFAQRAWVTRNCKGLQDEIKLVAINLEDKPAWYKDKVYHPQGTVPSLEHNGKVTGESLDLIKYIDSNFQGPALLPQDPAKREFADELIAYADAFTKALYAPLISRVDMSDEAVAALDKIEAALSKFSDGPFFLGQFSLADIAYVTVLERLQIYYSHVRNYEIAKGRPNLDKFIGEMNKIEAYKQTKNQPLILLDCAKRHLKIA